MSAIRKPITCQSVCEKTVFYTEKTVSSTKGHQRVTRLTIAIMKLAIAISPDQKEVLLAPLKDLSFYKNICYSVQSLTYSLKFLKNKKITILNVSAVGIASFASWKLYQKIPVVQQATNLFFRNFNTIFIAVEASYVLGKTFKQCCKAKDSEERNQILNAERCLQLANRVGKLSILALTFFTPQAVILISVIDVVGCVANLSNFLYQT